MTLVLLSVSVHGNQFRWSYLLRSKGLWRRTFRDVGSLVISFTEPSQVLVFNPGHPTLVLVVVVFLQPFCVRLLRLLFCREAVVFLLRLGFRRLRLASCFFRGHCTSNFVKGYKVVKCKLFVRGGLYYSSDHAPD